MADMMAPIPPPPPPFDTSSKSRKKKPKLNAQAQLSEFWSRYHSKNPARVTSIFPRKLYDGLVPVADEPGPQTRNAARSYEEARAKCKELVRRAVAECERTNCKYSDPEFDLDQDLDWSSFNCLWGLQRQDSFDWSSWRNNISESQLSSSLRTLVKSQLLKDNTAPVDIDQLQRMLDTADIGDYDWDRWINLPGSVHRVDWIFENPQFTVDGYSSSDIMQGRGGDCWWLAGLSSIAHRRDLMNKICVARDEECGVYGFVFYKDGEWISTVIDDNLYLKKGDYGEDRDTHDATGKKARLYRKEKQTGSKALYFSRCEDQNETWLPLLEKAYAKVHGDYEAIDGGWGGHAIEDLTGGVTTMVLGNRVLRKDRLWRELTKSGEENGEFVFALSAIGGHCMKDAQNGITLSHAYSVIKATEVQDEEGTRYRLVKVRNPWGERSSKGLGAWFGPWSNGSREWTPYMMQKLGHKFGDDGTFWMSFQDLLDNFRCLHRTRLFDEKWTVAQQWTSSSVSWVTGYLSKKFIIEVKHEGLVVIVLSQLDDRYFKGLEGQYTFTLEFMLRKVGSTAPLCQVKASHNRLDRRSVNCELELEPGTYEVLPKITAERHDSSETIGQVVKKYADKNPEKLRQIGMQYDAAHAKAGVIDEDDELEKARCIEKKKKQKKRRKQREKKQKDRAARQVLSALGLKPAEDKDDESEDEADKKDKKKEKKWKRKSASIKGMVQSSVEFLKHGDNASQKASSHEDGKDEGSEAGSSGSSTSSASTIDTPASSTKDKKEVEEEEKEEAEKSDSDCDSDDSSSSDSESDGEVDMDQKRPWDPVCVMGLRVYAQDSEVSVNLSEKDKGEDVARGAEPQLAAKPS